MQMQQVDYLTKILGFQGFYDKGVEKEKQKDTDKSIITSKKEMTGTSVVVLALWCIAYIAFLYKRQDDIYIYGNT